MCHRAGTVRKPACTYAEVGPSAGPQDRRRGPQERHLRDGNPKGGRGEASAGFTVALEAVPVGRVRQSRAPPLLRLPTVFARISRDSCTNAGCVSLRISLLAFTVVK